MIIFGLFEIRIVTKKRQIKEVLEKEGRLKAIKKCKELIGCSLSDSIKYIDKF